MCKEHALHHRPWISHGSWWSLQRQSMASLHHSLQKIVNISHRMLLHMQSAGHPIWTGSSKVRRKPWVSKLAKQAQLLQQGWTTH